MQRIGILTAAGLILALFAPSCPLHAGDADKQALIAIETAFASTVATKDKDKFAAMIADDATFIGPSGVKRGKHMVVEAWASLFDPASPLLEWHPLIAELSADGTIGITRGPWVLRGKGKDGKATEERGTFNSVWRKGSDGSWKILFDAGCPCADPVKKQ
jgi:ketosteroid isomerase-like protein